MSCEKSGYSDWSNAALLTLELNYIQLVFTIWCWNSSWHLSVTYLPEDKHLEFHSILNSYNLHSTPIKLILNMWIECNLEVSLCLDICFYLICTAQQVTLSSSLEDSGRIYACPNQLVTYTCVSNSRFLIWSAPPFLSDQNPIIFRSTDQLGGRVQPNIFAALLSTTPIMRSTLQVLNATSNATVNCGNGAVAANQMLTLQLAGKFCN